MRLIDVCIPKFGDEEDSPVLAMRPSSAGFQLPPVLFGPAEQEYNVEVDGDASGDGSQEELFFEAADGTSRESAPDEVEKPLGDISSKRFMLAFAVAKYDIKVDINLRSLSWNFDDTVH
ncbi:hypothetical protein DXG01_015368, partial [Tephrocybe rancida]